MPALRTRDTPSQRKSHRSSSQDPDLTIHSTVQPPSLAIISPTSRAISFPFNQTETSPYASPTSSLFEPDLRKLTISQQWKALSRGASVLGGASKGKEGRSTSRCTPITSIHPREARIARERKGSMAMKA
ncbi:hypothetical protein L210DRAFT_954414, partial [Boletus edulis BED1]